MSSSDPPGSAASSVASLDPNNSSTNKGPSILDRIYHRTVAPTDLRPCHALESSSYPSDEAASLSTLQYRQHHAARYFRCSVILDADTKATDSLKMSGKIVGFVTGTRCWDFNDASLSTHDPRGPMLAIHSVVVDEEYRNQGVGGTMLTEYVSAIRKMDLTYPLDRIVLMAKADKLAFYVRAGFQVVGVSPIVHGRDVWYECSLNVRPDGGGGGGVVGGGTNTLGTNAAGTACKPLGLGESSTAGSRPCWIVDSFADVNRAGSGNPAAVVLCPPGAGPDGDKYERWMQTVAVEFNLSETAFVWEKAGTGTGSGSGSGGENGGSSGAGAGAGGIGTGTGAGGGGDGGETIRYAIRYYTRTGAEVDLCGHATLAAASVLLQAANTSDGRIPRRTEVSSVVFYARNDVLKATVAKKEGSVAAGGGGGGGGGSSSSSSSSSAPNLRIAMDFPWRSVRAVDKPADRVAVLDMLKTAFGIEEGGANAKAEGGAEEQAEGGGADGRGGQQQNGLRNILYLGIDSVGEDLLVELTPEAFGKVGPENTVDISALGAWGGGYKRGVILCCLANKKGGGTGDEQDGSGGGGGSKRTEEHEEAAAAGGAGGIDFHSRFFGPKVGIDEDPVTGSAHCTLGPYFASKLGGGRSRVVGWQASARGGVVECILQDNGGSNGGGEGGDDDDDGGKARRVCIVGTAVTTVTGTLHI